MEQDPDPLIHETDPDPYKNETDPKHWYIPLLTNDESTCPLASDLPADVEVDRQGSQPSNKQWIWIQWIGNFLAPRIQIRSAGMYKKSLTPRPKGGGGQDRTGQVEAPN